jgi:hypothetical protein
MSRKKKIYDFTLRTAINLSKKPLFSMLKYMADTGYATSEAYSQGFLPVSTHFYQPIPDINELERLNAWDKVRQLPDHKLSLNDYSNNYTTITSAFATECVWPIKPTNNPTQYYIDNGTFTFGCASTLHCYIRHLKPRRIIEIGSGNSSRVINTALAMNKSKNAISAEYTIIDPYSQINTVTFTQCTEILKQQIQFIPLEKFKELSAGDILFIDSSHTSKIGSDVNFLILEVLPILNEGVVIHFHDIPMPFEYEKKYTINDEFRVFWNESYLLEAFLLFNKKFQITIPMAYLQAYNMELLLNQFPQARGLNFGFCSGSFWIEKSPG